MDKKIYILRRKKKEMYKLLEKIFFFLLTLIIIIIIIFPSTNLNIIITIVWHKFSQHILIFFNEKMW